MGLFQKNQNQQSQMPSQRQRLEGRYHSARTNLLWVLLFSVVNIILLLTKSFTYFLFSAFIPYVLVDYGMVVCGKYPEEFYGDLSQYEFLSSSVLVVLIAIAAVICIFYLLCWLFSGKGRVGWLITALVLFCLDTALMILNGIGADSILDVVFHGLIIVSLSRGVAAHFKMKKLPVEEPEMVFADETVAAPVEEPVSAELPQE